MSASLIFGFGTFPRHGKYRADVSSALRRTTAQSSSRFAYQAPPESASAESALLYGLENPIPDLPAPHLADRYFTKVFDHVQAQYAFLDWHALKLWHDNRDGICMNRPMWGSGRGSDHGRAIAAFLLWLVYGYGARLTQDERLEGSVSHEVGSVLFISCYKSMTTYRADAV